MKNWLRSAALPLAVACLIAPAFAKKKDDPLERMTPVPAHEPIPVIDFFRPPLFTNPELNPAGTHFAAIVSTRDDRRDLVAFDLATKKAERISGGTDYDISRYEWLNDKRLLFSVIRDKLYSYGLFAVELGRFSQSYVLQLRNSISPVGFPKNNPLHAIIWIRHSSRDNGADGGVIKIDTRRSMDGKDGVLFLNGDDGIRADIVHSYANPPEGIPLAYMADHLGELAFAITSKDGRSTLYRYANEKWERSALNLGRYSLVGVGDKTDELLVLAEKKPGQGLIDPDRLAIMGTSFGGYLALSGAAHEPDLYRCAISVAGVFDWERLIKDYKNSEYARGAYGLLRRKLGDPKLVQEKFEAISPIKHVAKIKIPIFVAHGTEDKRAAIAQSKELIKELKKHGVPHEKQIERNEGHGFLHVENQVELYTAVEAFLAKHLARRTPIVAKATGAEAPAEIATASP